MLLANCQDGGKEQSSNSSTVTPVAASSLAASDTRPSASTVPSCPTAPFLVTQIALSEGRMESTFEDIVVSELLFSSAQELRDGMGKFYAEFAPDWGACLTVSASEFQARC